MLIGDLPMHIELDELSNYDIFTYHFGDAFRLYLRGQFAAHANTAKVDKLRRRTSSPNGHPAHRSLPLI